MTDQPLPQPADDAETMDVGEASIFGPRRLMQALVIVTLIVSCFLYALGAGLAHWPAERGFQGSLAQPVDVLAWVVVIALLAICTALGTLVLGRYWPLAGLMTATAGLAVWAARGGPSTYVLLRAHASGADAGVFLRLLFEQVVLLGAIGAIWNILWTRDARASLPPAAPRAGNEGRSAGAAILAQVGILAIFVLILAAAVPIGARKKQVLTGVFVASWGATMIAEVYFADRKAGRWYWVGPLAVGAIGYVANYLSPAGIEIGDPAGLLGPLARVLPLDYASLGCAGALLGYWMGMPENDGEDEEAPIVLEVAEAE